MIIVQSVAIQNKFHLCAETWIILLLSLLTRCWSTEAAQHFLSSSSNCQQTFNSERDVLILLSIMTPSV